MFDHQVTISVVCMLRVCCVSVVVCQCCTWRGVSSTAGGVPRSPSPVQRRRCVGVGSAPSGSSSPSSVRLHADSNTHGVVTSSSSSMLLLLLSSASRPKRLLVYINPFSGKRRGQSVYEQQVAPLFARAGVSTHVIGTPPPPSLPVPVPPSLIRLRCLLP